MRNAEEASAQPQQPGPLATPPPPSMIYIYI